MVEKHKTHQFFKFSFSIFLILIFCVNFKLGSDERKRINNSVDVVSQLMDTPDKGVPSEIMDKAECIAVIPSMKKGAFIFGARYGKGLVSCKRSDTKWTAPAFFEIKGGSFGFQIGGQTVDLVLFIMNKKGIDHLLQDKFTLGTDASVAAGPVGRSANAETDAKLQAEILAYSRTQGLFAGVSLTGAVMKPDKQANRQLYGKNISAKEILITGNPAVPQETKAFIDLLNKESGKKN